MTTQGPNRPPFSKKAARGLPDVIDLARSVVNEDGVVEYALRVYPSDHPVHAALEYLEKLDAWIRARGTPAQRASRRARERHSDEMGRALS